MLNESDPPSLPVASASGPRIEAQPLPTAGGSSIELQFIKTANRANLCKTWIKQPPTTSCPAHEGPWFFKASDFDTSAERFVPLPLDVVNDIDDLARLLRERASAPDTCMILGTLNAVDARVAKMLKEQGSITRSKNEIKEKRKRNGSVVQQLPCFVEVARRAFMIDIDPTQDTIKALRNAGVDLYCQPEKAVRTTVNLLLPPDIAATDMVCLLSSTAGLGKVQRDGQTLYRQDGAVAKLHVFIILERPLLPQVFKRLIEDQNALLKMRGLGEKNLDGSLYDAVHPHYTANPLFYPLDEAPDPFADRLLVLRGQYRFPPIKVEERVCSPARGGRKPKTERVLVGQATHVPIDRRRKPWANTWREQMARIGDHADGFHPGLFATVSLLVQSLTRTSRLTPDMCQETIKLLLTPYLAEIEAVTRKAPLGGRPASYIENELANLFDNMVMWVVDREFSRGAFQLGDPHYPSSALSFEVATEQLQDVIDNYAKAALAVYGQRQDWERALAERRQPSSLLPPEAQHVVLAAELGLGKSRALIDALLLIDRILMVDLNAVRFYITVPDHELAAQLAALYEQRRRELIAAGRQVRAPEKAMTYKGRRQEGMCLAPEEIKNAALLAEKNGFPVRQAACDQCPVRDGCLWLGQFADKTPGLKIVVRQTLGANAIPGFPRDDASRAKQDADGWPPILGMAFDEGLGDALDVTITAPIADCSKELGTKMIDWLVKEIERRLHQKGEWRSNRTADASDVNAAHGRAVKRVVQLEANAGYDASDTEAVDKSSKAQVAQFLEALQRAVETRNDAGELPLSSFADLFALAGEAPGATRLDVIQKALSRLISESTSIGIELLKDRGNPSRSFDEDAQPILKARHTLRFIRELVLLVAESSAKRTHLQCVIVRDNEIAITARRIIPEALRHYPLLVLDATAEKTTALIPFARHSLSGRGFEWNPNVTFHSCKVEAPHAVLVKITNAPVAMYRLRDPARERLDAAEDTGGEVERLAQSSDIETIMRVLRAWLGRVANSGLISYKPLEEYLIKTDTVPPGVILGHLGKVRGRNDWEKVPVLVVVGRQQLGPTAYEDLAAATYTCDPDDRVITRLRAAERMEKTARNLRLKADGTEIGAPVFPDVHPCSQVQAVVDQHVLAEDMQAIGRGRAIRRDAENPLLVVVLNDLCPDMTFDAIIDWEVVKEASAEAVILHAMGFLPDSAADRTKLMPQLFDSTKQAQLQKDRSETARGSSAPAPLYSWTGGALARKAFEHPLLKPAAPKRAEVTFRRSNRHTKNVTGWLDEHRAEVGARNLAASQGGHHIGWRWLEAADEANIQEPGSNVIPFPVTAAPPTTPNAGAVQSTGASPELTQPSRGSKVKRFPWEHQDAAGETPAQLVTAMPANDTAPIVWGPPARARDAHSEDQSPDEVLLARLECYLPANIENAKEWVALVKSARDVLNGWSDRIAEFGWSLEKLLCWDGHGLFPYAARNSLLWIMAVDGKTLEQLHDDEAILVGSTGKRRMWRRVHLRKELAWRAGEYLPSTQQPPSEAA